MPNETVGRALDDRGWFQRAGAYVVVDGQYGSTGKGVISALLGEHFGRHVRVVLSNAGPNSGHTSYHGDRKIVLKQLPTFSVFSYLSGGTTRTCLTAGAIIEPSILSQEIASVPDIQVHVHPNAAVIWPEDKARDAVNVQSMASTGSGVGPAMIRKLERTPEGVFSYRRYENIKLWSQPERDLRIIRNDSFFMEVSQGYSLGINSGFYPHVTSRECTVSQALADAGLPPTVFQRSILSLRTFPIRVGDTTSSSGPCYPDQRETSWEELGVEPELTTVTKRVRRVFTWSCDQFERAVLANASTTIYLNFMNYLLRELRESFVRNSVLEPFWRLTGRYPKAVLLGFGPRSEDVFLWDLGTDFPVPERDR